MKDQIVKEKLFNHSIDKVWKAITEAEQISKWFIHADFKAEAGYQYTLTATEEHGSTKVKGRVLEANPYTLKYTWGSGESAIETIVTWTLKQEGSQTKLILVHSGISKHGEAAEEVMGHFDMGWDACLSVLPNYLKDGQTEPAH
ncbi:MAG: SRPBCC domain-containing protein [Cytophagales bacterium]